MTELPCRVQTMKGPSWSLKQLSVDDTHKAPITPAELEKIAQLAGLSVPAENVAKLHSEVAGMINWMGQIRHVETTRYSLTSFGWCFDDLISLMLPRRFNYFDPRPFSVLLLFHLF